MMRKNTVRNIGCVLLLCLLAVSLLAGCEEESVPAPTMYTVTYDSAGGTPIPEMTVAENSLLSRPSDPTRENYIFDGWVYNGELWLFETSRVHGNLTLTATWKSAASVFDYELIEGKEEARLTRLKLESPTVIVPSSINSYPVTAIGDDLFAKLSAETVSAISLPESVTAIGARAFLNCADISILVRGALTEVGEQAFEGCNTLEEIPLGEGLTSVGSRAFYGTGLTSLSLPKSLTLVEEDAFAYCSALTTVVMYGTASEGELVVGDSAFRDCDALKTVFFHGDENEHDALLTRIAYGNAPLTDAAFSYYSETEPTEEGSYWYYRNGKPRIW